MVKLFNSQVGDTIIEVLISITVVSLVLAGAFVTSRRSTNAVRTAQERGEAIKYAESQVEQLRAAVNKGTNLPATFCFKSDGTGALDTPPCIVTNGIDYRQTISKNGADYSTIVEWDGLAGGVNKVQLDYRSQQ